MEDMRYSSGPVESDESLAAVEVGMNDQSESGVPMSNDSTMVVGVRCWGN